MTMEYFIPPNSKTSSRFTRQDLKHFTRDVPDNGLRPGERIVLHYGAIYPFIPNSDRSCLGSTFVQCIYDSLIHFGANVTATHKEISPSSDADADIVVENRNHTYPFLVKTSYRERWKQIDRDGRIMEEVKWSFIHPRAIVFCESPAKFFALHKRDPDLQRVYQGLRADRNLHAKVAREVRAKDLKIISAIDLNAMDDLFIEIGARTF